jgi:hypothetical protein
MATEKDARKKPIGVTLAPDVLAGIRRFTKNRSKFIERATRREIKRLERKAFRASLDARVITDEDRALERASLRDLAAQAPISAAEVADMIDESAFRPVQWVSGKGWQK